MNNDLRFDMERKHETLTRAACQTLSRLIVDRRSIPIPDVMHCVPRDRVSRVTGQINDTCVRVLCNCVWMYG